MIFFSILGRICIKIKQIRSNAFLCWYWAALFSLPNLSFFLGGDTLYIFQMTIIRLSDLFCCLSFSVVQYAFSRFGPGSKITDKLYMRQVQCVKFDLNYQNIFFLIQSTIKKNRGSRSGNCWPDGSGSLFFIISGSFSLITFS